MSTATAIASPRAASLLWPLAAVVLTAVVGATRLLFNEGFYFADDTQLGAFGQWWQLGERLLAGSIPVLDPQAWQAGNYFAEGQWGLLNPLTWLIAIGARASEDPAAYSALVKIVFLALMAGGVYLLARSFGASPPWAAVAGVLVPMGGFTSYMDAPSWVTGLLNASVLPWAWWGLRRLVDDGRSPIAYLVASYLLITFGYVFGVIVLVIVLVEALIRSVVARDWVRTVRVLTASTWGALLTLAVYLPGVLTAPVTERAGFDIFNNWFLSADLSDLASSASPLASASILAWWGPVTNGPLVYVAWILPFVPLFAPMSREAVRRCIPLFVLAGATLLVVLGPSNVGPIRWPVRFMPYVCLAVIIIVAVMATRTFPRRVSRAGAAWSAVAILLTTGISFANTPGGWKGIGAIAVVQTVVLAGLLVVAWMPRSRLSEGARTGVAAGVAVGVSAALVLPQMVVFAATPLPDFAVPDSTSRMSTVLDDVEGDGIVVGDIYADSDSEASFDERLMANLWYLSPASVGSLYTVLPYSTFSKDLCTDLRGSTCSEALETLWSTDPDTGITVADLMGVSTIVAIRASFPVPPAPAPGWDRDDSGTYTTLYRRNATVPVAGGVAWSGDGTEVTVEEQGETSLTFRVDEVGTDGRVVLSRLDYPGYSVDGAQHVDPVRGWLLTVDVADAEPGDVVTVSFRPPGYVAMIAAFGLAAVILVAWPILVIRRRRAVSAGPADPSAAPGRPG